MDALPIVETNTFGYSSRKVGVMHACVTGSEDFAFTLEKLPGCYLFIGNGDGVPGMDGKPTSPCMVHNPGYNFNDANIGVGSAYWVALTQRFLSAESQS